MVKTMNKLGSQQVQRGWINSILESQIRDFIKTIAANLTPDSNFQAAEDLQIFGNEEEGYLFLTDQEARDFREIIRAVPEKYFSSMLISRQFVEKSIQASILEALDIKKHRENITFEQRLNQSIERVKGISRQKPTEYEYFYPVYGLDNPGLPFKIGQVELFIFQECTLDEIYRKNNEDIPTKQNIVMDQIFKDFEIDKLFGTVYAKVTVTAVDQDAAKNIAKNILQSTLELLNFFIDLIPYSNGVFLYLPGEACKDLIFSASRSKNINIPPTICKSVAGPISNVTIQMLMQANEKNNLGFENVCRILSGKPNPFQDGLLSAMRWGGKAMINQAMKLNEQAFLFYTIALESIILLEGSKEELRYRLSVRLAHLFGKSGEYRPGIAKQVRDLYDIRSKIVHNGSFEVFDSDLNLIRFIVKNCLIHLVRDEPFASMKNKEDLVAWFDQQIYG